MANREGCFRLFAIRHPPFALCAGDDEVIALMGNRRLGRADGDRPGGGLVPAHGFEEARPTGGLALLAGGFSGWAAFPRAFARHLTPRMQTPPEDFAPLTKSHRRQHKP